MESNKLSQLRDTIKDLDQQLLNIFAQRRQASLMVAENKYKNQLDIRDRQQEKYLLGKLVERGNTLGIAPSVTMNLFHNIIEDSIRSQYDYFLSKKSLSVNLLNIALLGEKNSYSDIAAQNHFATKPQQLSTQYCQAFNQIFEKVAIGEVDLGFVPIENTTSGNITEVHDLLLKHRLNIIGEEKLKVKHCLVSIKNTSLEQIKDVYSHPQAISQCNEFFAQHPKINSHYRSSTSSAINLVDEYQNPTIGAIASELAAQNAGLQILKHGINNYQENYTRFLLIAKKPITVPNKVPAKTSIILHTKQKTGSLVDCLSVFKNNSINITKLESRPIPNKAWQEMFYLDFEGNINELSVAKALAELEQISSHLQLIGCYPQHDILATKLDANALNSTSATQQAT